MVRYGKWNWSGERIPEPDVIWDLEPHTEAKHRILREYLKAWFPILSNSGRFNSLFYVDGFAGPGIYSKGEDGSPIVAIKTARDHALFDSLRKIHFIFIEKDQERCDNLNQIINSMKDAGEIPEKFSCHVYNSEFDTAMNLILDQLREEGSGLIGSFIFIDPFGYSGMPMNLMKRLMSNLSCEILITFMCDPINRFLCDPSKASEWDSLFNSNEWSNALKMESGERVHHLSELYTRQLQSFAGAKFTRIFEMIGSNGHNIYDLVFGTNSFEGFKKMKEAMWKVDEVNGCRFADRTNTCQSTLLSYSEDMHYSERLTREIYSKFKGKIVTIEEIEEFVWKETPYVFQNVKASIIKPLEEEGRIIVDSSPRKRRFTYPADTVIRFMN